MPRNVLRRCDLCGRFHASFLVPESGYGKGYLCSSCYKVWQAAHPPPIPGGEEDRPEGRDPSRRDPAARPTEVSDMRQLAIRAADAGDAAMLTSLIHAAFVEYAGRLDPPSSAHAKTPEVVRAELADGGALVAELGGVPVGCVFWHRHPDHLYLDRLSVLPERRHGGVGRALVEAVERLAAELRLERVRLGVRLALPDNRAYYERMGYALLHLGTHKGYAEPTYAILEKRRT